MYTYLDISTHICTYLPISTHIYPHVPGSAALYCVDYGLDAAVVVWLARERGLAGRAAWVSCTAALILVPLSIVNIFSIVWHHEDHTGAY